MDEEFLKAKLAEREAGHSLRQLQRIGAGVDFCSNDYLGIVKNNLIDASDTNREKWLGSTGSRLISGNYDLVEKTENSVAGFHQAAAGLIFNSGYDANLGLLACVPQRGDTVVYDQLSHASIRDGVRLSKAASFSFAHNDLDDLEKKLQQSTGRKFVVTESVFSMDGDIAPLAAMTALCSLHDALLILDEAHATGVLGNKGEGLAGQLSLEKSCFARVHTFGKALGCHGAIVLGSADLKNYLVNFSRPFIYTTALPAGAVAAISAAYALIPGMHRERRHLLSLVNQFRTEAMELRLIDSPTPIQGVIVPGNEEVSRVADLLHTQGINVFPIRYPTVPKGSERLRIVLHAFNRPEEVSKLTTALTQKLY